MYRPYFQKWTLIRSLGFLFKYRCTYCQSATYSNLFYLISCRVLTGAKSWASTQTIIGAEQDSVWGQIYRNQMTDESFEETTNAIIETLLKSNELLTGYSYIEDFIYNAKPCQLKVVWKSPGKNL